MVSQHVFVLQESRWTCRPRVQRNTSFVTSVDLQNRLKPPEGLEACIGQHKCIQIICQQKSKRRLESIHAFPSSSSLCYYFLGPWQPSLHFSSPAGSAPGAQHPVPSRYTSTHGSQQGRTSTLLTREPVEESKGDERKDGRGICPSAPVRSTLVFYLALILYSSFQ